MSDSHCPRYLITFDCSSTAIGYGYFVDRCLIDCGFVLSRLTTVQARIVDLMGQIKGIFGDIGKDVVVVMEWSEGRPMAFLKKKGRSAQSSVPLAHAQGALFYWIINQGLDLVPIGESEWTKRRGKYLSKADRAVEVHFRYPEFRQVWIEDSQGEKHDAADAVGLGDWYIGEMLVKDACSEGLSLQTRILHGKEKP